LLQEKIYLFSFVNFYFAVIFSGLWNNSFTQAASTLFYLVLTDIVTDLSQGLTDYLKYGIWIDLIEKDPYFSEGSDHIQLVE
jgi:hypothetical protein